MCCEPRVLILMRGGRLFGGGTERRFWRLFQHMRETGHDVHLLVNRRLLECLEKGTNSSEVEGGPDWSNQNPAMNIHVFEDDDNISGTFGSIVRFNLYAIKMYRVLRPSTVHLVLIQKSLIPFYLWLWTQHSLKVVNTMAFSHFAHRSQVSLSTRLTAWLIWQRADVIDSLYPTFALAAGRRYRHKIAVSPCSFTDPEEFRPAPHKDNVIVFAGRLIDEKNPLLFVKALALLNRADPLYLRDWRAYVLGEGPLERELREEIVQNGLEAIVSIERVHCTSSYLRKARVFVSLQRTENYPSQSLLEAMSSGCAVIATDVGETRRLIDGKTGLLVKNDSPSELADAMSELMADPQRCNALGHAARERVLAEHTLARFAEYMGQLWEGSGCR